MDSSFARRGGPSRRDAGHARIYVASPAATTEQAAGLRPVSSSRSSLGIRAFRTVLTMAAIALLFPGFTGTAQAQLDTEHWIPPFYARAAIGTHYILVSTLETTPFDVTVHDGAGNLIHTFTGLNRSTAAPDNEFALPGANYNQLGVLDQPELNTVNTEGMVLRGSKPFLVNIRHRESAQGFSLTSKGTFGLGTDFRSGHLFSGMAQEDSKAHFISVMATEDGTEVTFGDIDAGIAFMEGACGNKGDAPAFASTVTLDAGEAYVVAYNFDCPASNLDNDPNDVNGVHVTATKPIAFTSGSWLGGARDGDRKDIGTDQAVPVDRLGSSFIVIEGNGGAFADLLERPGVVAAYDNTEIYVGGGATAIATINAGDYFFIPASNYSAAGNMYITTSQPAFLYQSTSGNTANANGMSFIPPLRCNGTSEVVIPDADLVGSSGLGIIARAGASLSITDDTGSVDPGTPNAVTGTTDWVTYNVDVSGDVEIVSDNVINVSLVTNAGDRGSAGFFSGFANSPAVSVTGGTTDLCETSPITLMAEATVGFDSFQWYRNGSAIDGATASTYDASVPGDYTVAGVFANDPTSEICNGGASAQSPPITLDTFGCVCGDSNIDPLEECDDGNTNPDDGCGPTCLIEYCGDGIDNNGTETCDDGNATNGDGCDDDTANGGNCTITACGNGVVTSGESCDDGNATNGDGCDDDIANGGNCTLTACGNGVVTSGETCDDGNATNNDGCDDDTANGGNCSPTGCGNGVVTAGETCDDGNQTNGDTCDDDIANGGNCTPTGCGNGVVTAGETCDDGNQTNGDTCDDDTASGGNCTPTGCGNGVVTAGESCDDGNATNGDGCDDDTASGGNCTATGCGNGVVTAGETCDDGNQTNDDGCDDDIGSGGTCVASGCGNGVINAGESCDDGNATNGDGCDDDTASGGNCTATGCGNGVVTAGETCDDGNQTNDDGCDDDTANGGTCVASGCGNGVINAGESCDDGNATNGDGCDDDTASGGNCSATGCGNGVVTAGETCDDGNATNGDGCDDDTASGGTCVPTGCGNGIVTAGEECDDGNTDRDDGCGATCLIEYCGDGLINNLGEECDDANSDDGDGCDSGCNVETGWECAGEPSVCTEINPNLDQLFRGTWPDIDVRSQYIVFVSPDDLHNDPRVGVDNADGDNEVFVLDMKAKRRQGPGICLGGSNAGLDCLSRRDCPSSGPVVMKPCGRFLQLTDTVGAGAPYAGTAISNGGRMAAYSDSSGGPSTVPTWQRKVFEKTSLLPSAINDIGPGSAPAIDRGSKTVAIESTADITGGNPDGNSEIFLYDVRAGTWQQVTDTLAPVQNHRPLSTFKRRFVFDSNGDIGDATKKGLSNADLNRELFIIRLERKKTRILQLTDTTGTDLIGGCAAHSGNWAFFSSDGDLNNDTKAPASNADGNVELFLWRRSKLPGGTVKQITVSSSGENVNADCTPGGRLVVFESTSDLDSDGSSNRRVYVQNSNSGKRRLLSPSPDGDSVRPRISRRKVVFSSTSNLTESNPGGESVIYLYDLSIGADDLIAP